MDDQAYELIRYGMNVGAVVMMTLGSVYLTARSWVKRREAKYAGEIAQAQIDKMTAQDDLEAARAKRLADMLADTNYQSCISARAALAEKLNDDERCLDDLATAVDTICGPIPSELLNK